MTIKTVNGHAWCDVCKKFTKQDGTHDCDPNWRERLQKGRGMAGKSLNKTRRWRPTPKRLERLKKICKYAALGKSLQNNKAVAKVKTETLDKRAHQFYKALGFK